MEGNNGCPTFQRGKGSLNRGGVPTSRVGGGVAVGEAGERRMLVEGEL